MHSLHMLLRPSRWLIDGVVPTIHLPQPALGNLVLDPACDGRPGEPKQLLASGLDVGGGEHGPNGLRIQPLIQGNGLCVVVPNEREQPSVSEFPFLDAGEVVRWHDGEPARGVADVRGVIGLDQTLGVGHGRPRAGADEALSRWSGGVFGPGLGRRDCGENGEAVFADELVDVHEERGHVVGVDDPARAECVDAVDKEHRGSEPTACDGDCRVYGLVVAAFLIEEREVVDLRGVKADASHVRADRVGVALAGDPAIAGWIGCMAVDRATVAPVVHDLEHEGSLAGASWAENQMELICGHDVLNHEGLGRR